jgi:hypothetical protein
MHCYAVNIDLRWILIITRSATTPPKKIAHQLHHTEPRLRFMPTAVPFLYAHAQHPSLTPIIVACFIYRRAGRPCLGQYQRLLSLRIIAESSHEGYAASFLRPEPGPNKVKFDRRSRFSELDGIFVPCREIHKRVNFRQAFRLKTLHQFNLLFLT